MTFQEFLRHLSDAPSDGSSIELDRQRELAYVRDHAYRFDRLARALPASREPVRILDIGTTPFTLFLKAARPSDEVWTVDRTDLLKERCERAGVRHETCDLDDGRLPFATAFFDLVFFAEVLEHLLLPHSEILGEVVRTVKPGGQLVVTVPNLATPSRRLKLLLGRSPLDPADEQLKRGWVHGRGHIHEYTHGELVALLRGADLEIGKMMDLQPSLSHGFHHTSGSTVERLARCVFLVVGRCLPWAGHTLHAECVRPGGPQEGDRAVG